MVPPPPPLLWLWKSCTTLALPTSLLTEALETVNVCCMYHFDHVGGGRNNDAYSLVLLQRSNPWFRGLFTSLLKTADSKSE